jgi:hypothetical protein
MSRSPPSTRSSPSAPHGHHPLLAPDAPRPLLDERKRQLCVRSLRRVSAELGPYPAPNRLAALLGVRLVWRTDFDAEEGTFKVKNLVGYDWDTDPRQRHLNMLLATVRVFLRRERMAHNASDVWLVTLDFAVPMEAGCTDPEEMVADQPHCPEAIIRQVLTTRGSP